MTGKTSEKYEKIQSKIEKAITPYITLRILMPQAADREAHMKLENDVEFLESLKNHTKEWLITRKAPESKKQTRCWGRLETEPIPTLLHMLCCQ
jgi:hypothetical protein